MKWNAMISIITVTGCILCLLPIFSSHNLRLNMNFFYSGKDLSKALKSTPFLYSIIISLTSTVTFVLLCLLNCLLPRITTTRKQYLKFQFQFLSLVFVVIFSDILLLSYCIPFQDTRFYLCLFNFRDLLLFNIVIMSTNIHNNLFINNVYSVIISCIISSGFVLYTLCHFYFSFLYMWLLPTTLWAVGGFVFLSHLSLLYHTFRKQNSIVGTHSLIYSLCILSLSLLSVCIILILRFLDLCIFSDWISSYFSYYHYIELGTVLLITVLVIHGEEAKVDSSLPTILPDDITKLIFMRFISHEIRTPLNIVIMGLHVLENELKSNDSYHPNTCVSDTLESIQHSCQHAVHVLNNMILYDSIENGLMTLNKEVVNIMDFIDEVMQAYYHVARNAGISLQLSTMHIEPQSTIFIDRHKIAYALNNIITNALKFTSNGGHILVEVSFPSSRSTSSSIRSSSPMSSHHRSMHLAAVLSNSDEFSTSKLRMTNQPCLRIKVTDSGVGISPENQKKLFDNIIQFSPGVLQGGGGPGLGLYISKGYVSLHYGSIYVQSHGEGHGSTFTVDLPMTSPSFVDDDSYLRDAATVDTTTQYLDLGHTTTSNSEYNSRSSTIKSELPPLTINVITPTASPATPPKKSHPFHMESTPYSSGGSPGGSLIKVERNDSSISTRPASIFQLSLRSNTIIDTNTTRLLPTGGSSTATTATNSNRNGKKNNRYSDRRISLNQACSFNVTGNNSNNNNNIIHNNNNNNNSNNISNSNSNYSNDSNGYLKHPRRSLLVHTENNTEDKRKLLGNKSLSLDFEDTNNNDTTTTTNSPTSNSYITTTSTTTNSWQKSHLQHSILEEKINNSTINSNDNLRLRNVSEVSQDDDDTIDDNNNNNALIKSVRKVSTGNHFEHSKSATDMTSIDATSTTTSLKITSSKRNRSCDMLASMQTILSGDHSDASETGGGGGGSATSSTCIKRQTSASIYIDDVDDIEKGNEELLVRILIVDDVELNRKMLHRLFMNYHGNTIIHEAEDGAKAIDLVRESIAIGAPYHVITMDYQMPILDGPSSTKFIRESIGYSGIILGVTGNALPCDIDLFIEKGANKVFLKPVSTQMIEEIFEEIFNKKQIENQDTFSQEEETDNQTKALNPRATSFPLKRRLSTFVSAISSTTGNSPKHRHSMITKL